MEFHLDRIRVLRPFDEFQILRIGWIGHIQNRPTAMPFVPHVKIPTARHLANCHFKCSASAVETAVADGLHVARLPTLWNRVGRGEQRQSKQYQDRHPRDVKSESLYRSSNCECHLMLLLVSKRSMICCTQILLVKSRSLGSA